MARALVTVAAALLAFAALDDITTDHDTSFVVERGALALCFGWFAWVAWRFIAERERWLGVVSVVVLAAAVLAQPSVGQSPPASLTGYLVTLACLVWFLGVAGVLAIQARRRRA